MDKLMEEQLISFIQQHMLEEKNLFAGSHQEGRALLAGLALAGQHWANLFPETFTGFIRRLLADDWAVEGRQPADATMTFLLVAELVTEVSETKEYFGRIGESPGVLRAVHSGIMTLRRHGIAAKTMDEADFIDPCKGRALITLLTAYEGALEQRRWLDEADILRRGILRVVQMNRETPWFIIAQGLWLRCEGLERAFLEAVPKEKMLVLGSKSGSGLNFASRETMLPYREETSLALEGFVAAGVTAEVREIFRRIIAEETPFESVAILTPTHGLYEQVIRDTAARLEISVTSGSGWSIAETRPGQMALSYLQWIRQGFPVQVLADALVSGYFTPPLQADGSSLSGTSTARWLRNAGIGWGLDRYRTMLELRCIEVAQMEVESDEEAAEVQTRLLQRAHAVKDWIDGLLEFAPQPDIDGRLQMTQLCRGVERIVREYTPVISSHDAAARATIAEMMVSAARWGTGRLLPGDAVDRLLAMIMEIRVGASAPRPGAVHLSSWSSGWTLGRPHLFMPGLDETVISTRPTPDPLLLDEERNRWNPALPTGAERLTSQLAAVGWSLGHLTGRVTLSYSTTLPGEDRESSPSPILLSIYRWVMGEMSKGYHDLADYLGTPVGQVPGKGDRSLFSEEAWLQRIAADPLWGTAIDGVEAAFPNLAWGRRSNEARASDIFTYYDGRIDPDPIRLDPCSQPEMTVSASRLEMLGRCPLSYFFRYVLGVKPPDELGRDLGAWLDRMIRGEVLHDIYRIFYQRLGRKVSGGIEEAELLSTVCDEVLTAKRRALPSPSEAVFERERAEIMNAAAAFLALERLDQNNATPRWFETPIGFGPGSVDENTLGIEEPVAIQISDGRSFRFAGRIDRIDAAGDHIYHVWDYKTGRPYRDRGVVRRGRRLQHALYAIAAETVLQQKVDPEARVTLSGYRFSTIQGEGQPLWLAEGDGRAAADRALRSLLELVRTGAFPAAEDGEGCRICDYLKVCTDEPAKATKRKLEAGDPWLAPLMEVKEIE